MVEDDGEAAVLEWVLPSLEELARRWDEHPDGDWAAMSPTLLADLELREASDSPTVKALFEHVEALTAGERRELLTRKERYTPVVERFAREHSAPSDEPPADDGTDEETRHWDEAGQLWLEWDEARQEWLPMPGQEGAEPAPADAPAEEAATPVEPYWDEARQLWLRWDEARQEWLPMPGQEGAEPAPAEVPAQLPAADPAPANQHWDEARQLWLQWDEARQEWLPMPGQESTGPAPEEPAAEVLTADLVERYLQGEDTLSEAMIAALSKAASAGELTVVESLGAES